MYGCGKGRQKRIGKSTRQKRSGKSARQINRERKWKSWGMMEKKRSGEFGRGMKRSRKWKAGGIANERKSGKLGRGMKRARKWKTRVTNRRMVVIWKGIKSREEGKEEREKRWIRVSGEGE